MADKIVTYKGKQYKLLYRGKTKVGPDQCKLQWLDGSREFWVPGSAVGGQSGPVPKRGGRACAECGRPGTLVEDLEDGLLKHYNCCDLPSSS